MPTDCELKPAWSNLAKRLQSIAHCGYSGYTLIRVNILVNAYGYPSLWIEPDVVKLEPKSTDINKLLDELVKPR